MESHLPTTGDTRNEGIYLKRGSAFLRIINGTQFSGDFQPRISGLANSNISPGLVLVGTPSSENTSSRGILLRAGEETAMNMGNVLEISNYTNPLITVNTNGDLGIGTTEAKSKVHVKEGDVFIEDITSGIIMKSPDGQCWRYTPDNSGQLIASSVPCP